MGIQPSFSFYNPWKTQDLQRAIEEACGKTERYDFDLVCDLDQSCQNLDITDPNNPLNLFSEVLENFVISDTKDAEYLNENIIKFLKNCPKSNFTNFLKLKIKNKFLIEYFYNTNLNPNEPHYFYQLEYNWIKSFVTCHQNDPKLIAALLFYIFYFDPSDDKKSACNLIENSYLDLEYFKKNAIMDLLKKSVDKEIINNLASNFLFIKKILKNDDLIFSSSKKPEKYLPEDEVFNYFFNKSFSTSLKDLEKPLRALIVKNPLKFLPPLLNKIFSEFNEKESLEFLKNGQIFHNDQDHSTSCLQDLVFSKKFENLKDFILVICNTSIEKKYTKIVDLSLHILKSLVELENSNWIVENKESSSKPQLNLIQTWMVNDSNSCLNFFKKIKELGLSSGLKTFNFFDELISNKIFSHSYFYELYKAYPLLIPVPLFLFCDMENQSLSEKEQLLTFFLENNYEIKNLTSFFSPNYLFDLFSGFNELVINQLHPNFIQTLIRHQQKLAESIFSERLADKTIPLVKDLLLLEISSDNREGILSILNLAALSKNTVIQQCCVNFLKDDSAHDLPFDSFIKSYVLNSKSLTTVDRENEKISFSLSDSQILINSLASIENILNSEEPFAKKIQSLVNLKKFHSLFFSSTWFEIYERKRSTLMNSSVIFFNNFSDEIKSLRLNSSELSSIKIFRNEFKDVFFSFLDQVIINKIANSKLSIGIYNSKLSYNFLKNENEDFDLSLIDKFFSSVPKEYNFDTLHFSKVIDNIFKRSSSSSELKSVFYNLLLNISKITISNKKKEVFKILSNINYDSHEAITYLKALSIYLNSHFETYDQIFWQLAIEEKNQTEFKASTGEIILSILNNYKSPSHNSVFELENSFFSDSILSNGSYPFTDIPALKINRFVDIKLNELKKFLNYQSRDLASKITEKTLILSKENKLLYPIDIQIQILDRFIYKNSDFFDDYFLKEEWLSIFTNLELRNKILNKDLFRFETTYSEIKNLMEEKMISKILSSFDLTTLESTKIKQLIFSNKTELSSRIFNFYIARKHQENLAEKFLSIYLQLRPNFNTLYYLTYANSKKIFSYEQDEELIFFFKMYHNF